MSEAKPISCETCKFYKKSQFENIYGTCRRYPPIIHQLSETPYRSTTSFPSVRLYDWCGEYASTNT